jgi:hypothetical protein
MPSMIIYYTLSEEAHVNLTHLRRADHQHVMDLKVASGITTVVPWHPEKSHTANVVPLIYSWITSFERR